MLEAKHEKKERPFLCVSLPGFRRVALYYGKIVQTGPPLTLARYTECPD
jgi:hypothetical protein